MKRSIALALLIGTSPLMLYAHDLWLNALPQRLEKPGEVVLTLSLGEQLRVHEMNDATSESERIVTFHAFSDHGLRDLREELSGRSSSALRFLEGTHLVAMERDPAEINLDLEMMRYYLEEERHAHLIDRIPVGATRVRERFSRNLKTIVQVGEQVDPVWQTKVGHALEIIPLDDPIQAVIGQTIRVRLLFESSPLANAPISIHGMVNGEVFSEQTRTDDIGVARLPIPAPGAILIRSVHIRPIRDGAVDFESFWTAITFSVR